ncbi:ABC transporter permease [Enterococcus sp.]|uniref:ABC transporter permease n=1 Tax=Enterococcus sp. TaxID=35783 RepID=UPI0028A863DE|nr:ABC transporter permease [Enterococcus sp.]
MIAIYKREYRAYFQNMVGSFFLAFLIGFVGVYFVTYNLNYGYNFFAYALSSGLLMMILAVPILTMRSFSEERKSKTDQLLLTSPLKLHAVVVGKYLAMISILAMACLVFCLCPLIIKLQGDAHLKIDYTAILVFFLIGCVYIAVGMFISALTESQIIAAIGTMAALLLIYFWRHLVSFLPSGAGANVVMLLVLLVLVCLIVQGYMQTWAVTLTIGGVGTVALVIAYFAKSASFESLLSTKLANFDIPSILSNISDSYVLTLSSLVLLISLIVIFNFLTLQVMQKRRWS